MSAATKGKLRVVPKEPPKPETPWEAQERVLCGRPANYRLGDEDIAYFVKWHDEAARKGDEESMKRWRGKLMDTRHRNVDWWVSDDDGKLHDNIKGGCYLAVLLDIRDELQAIRSTLQKRRPARRKRAKRKAAGKAKAA